jgi:hypothetical protein
MAHFANDWKKTIYDKGRLFWIWLFFKMEMCREKERRRGKGRMV